MSEEKKKVLSMLKDGKITTEEALQLLNSLEDESPQSNDLPQWMKIFTQPHLIDIGDLGFGNKETFSIASDEVGQTIKSVKVVGKNSRVTITGYDERVIRITATYKVRSNREPNIALYEEDGRYALTYDSNAVYSMGLAVMIPNVFISKLYGGNKNATIEVRDIEAGNMDISTTNAPIELTSVKCKTLIAETKNAHIDLSKINAVDVTAYTTNAKLLFTQVFAEYSKLHTSNASISIENSDIWRINAKTSNAKIKLSGFINVPHNQGHEYSVTASTTNAELYVSIPEGSACSIDAGTSQGNIDADIPNLQLISNERNYLHAKSTNFEQSSRKVELSLKTTNGSVKLRNVRFM